MGSKFQNRVMGISGYSRTENETGGQLMIRKLKGVALERCTICMDSRICKNCHGGVLERRIVRQVLHQ